MAFCPSPQGLCLRKGFLGGYRPHGNPEKQQNIWCFDEQLGQNHINEIADC